MIKKTAAQYLEFVERAAKKAGLLEGVPVTSDYPDEAILEVAKRRNATSS